MQHTSIAALLGLLAGLCPPAHAQGAQTLGCLIEAENVSDLGSPVVGVIERLLVERGDSVRKGQTLAMLRADVERAATEVARSRAQAEAEYLAAQSNQAFAGKKLERTRDLVARNFLSQHALDEAGNEQRIAEQRVQQARQQLDIWERELKVSQAQLALRSLKSPYDGIVVERYLSLGERVEERPVFRVAQVDPLRVEVILPAARYGQIQRGQRATVRPDLPGVAAQQAEVTRVDKVIDAASNTFRVRLRLPNPEHALPAGMRCRIEFETSGVPAAPAAAPATPPVRPAT